MTKKCDIKNAILISFDSLRAESIATANAAEAPTFTLMRDHGAFFCNTIVQAPLTIPSHYAIISGLYPGKTLVRDMHHKSPDSVETLFTIFKRAGLATMVASRTPLVRKLRLRGIDRDIRFGHRSLARAIARPAGTPFFAFLHYWGTHTPYETILPGSKPIDLALNLLKPISSYHDLPYLGRMSEYIWLQRVKRIRSMMTERSRDIVPAVRSGYRKAVAVADKFVRKIIGALQKAGKADETLLVITGDHGDSFDEHGEVRRAADGRYEHGQFLYDNVLRVPLIFYCPGQSFARDFHQQVQQIDIMPSLCDALGIPSSGPVDGRSLWHENIIGGAEPEQEFAFSEVSRESLGIELSSVRTTRSKLIHDRKNHAFELYDLVSDPDEKCNLWPGHTYHQRDELMRRLEAFEEINSMVTPSPSADDQQEVRQMLRSLGYTD